jgi:hypothetical protein
MADFSASHGSGAGSNLQLDEAIVENLVREFATNWRTGIQQINDNVLSFFANFRNGMEILKQVDMCSHTLVCSLALIVTIANSFVGANTVVVVSYSFPRHCQEELAQATRFYQRPRVHCHYFDGD